MNNLVDEAKRYIEQLIHVKSNTSNRIYSAEKEFIEVSGDDTQSYWKYECFDDRDEFVISFSVNINNSVELIDDNDCY